jgi:AbrB family looped-hinge helix DNA binding protein
VTTTVSSKGQIVLPKKVRQSQQIKTGDDLEVIEQDDGILLRKLNHKPDWLDVLRSCPVKGFKIPPRRREYPRRPPGL